MLSSATESSSVLARQPLFRALDVGDVDDRGHGATALGARAPDLVDAAVGRMVLERPPGRIAQALDTLRDQGVDVAVAVVAVLGEVAQECRIRAPRRQQFGRSRVHLGEARVADDDVEVVVRIGERPRHVVERDLQLRLLARGVALGRPACGDVGVREDQAAMDDRRVLDVQDLSRRRDVLEFMRLAAADTVDARHRVRLDVARPVVAASRVVAVELGDLGAGLAQRSRIAAQRPERPVRRNQLEFAVEDRKAELQRVESGTDQNGMPVHNRRTHGVHRDLLSGHGVPPCPAVDVSRSERAMGAGRAAEVVSRARAAVPGR